MLPESLPSEFWDLKPIWKFIQEEGLPWALSWFSTDTIATITETPTHKGWGIWKWIKLPYTAPHPRWNDGESILCIPEEYWQAPIFSIGLAVLDAIARNIPDISRKYSLFKDMWSLHLLWGSEWWTWKFHFPETSDGWEWYVLSPNQIGINPYDITD